MVSNMSAYSDSDMPCASISAGVRGGIGGEHFIHPTPIPCIG